MGFDRKDRKEKRSVALFLQAFPVNVCRYYTSQFSVGEQILRATVLMENETVCVAQFLGAYGTRSVCNCPLSLVPASLQKNSGRVAVYKASAASTVLHLAVTWLRKEVGLQKTSANGASNGALRTAPYIMAYGSTPYVGMAPNKNGGHIKSAHMTRSKCLC